MFQVVELLAKLIYLPIKFSGKINSILMAISELGDPIEISPQLIMKGSLEDSHTNYKGKIFAGEEYGNVLQSMPISTSFFILTEILMIFLSLIGPNSSQKRKNGCNKAIRFINTVQMFILEANVIEIWFYCLLNLVIFPRLSSKNLWNGISFLLALYILISTIYKFLTIFVEVRSIISKMEQGKFETDFNFSNIGMAVEGLKNSELLSEKYLKYIKEKRKNNKSSTV